MTHKKLFPPVASILLAVTLMAGAVAAAQQKQASGLTARHQAGQTMLAWQEVDSPVTQATIAAVKLREIRRDMDKEHKVRYRIYRSAQPITSLEGLRPIAEVPPLTCWNIDYYGDLRPEQPALRYVIEEGRENVPGSPVPPGTGLWAHNPSRAGPAYYAVTLSIDGRENTALGPGNVLAAPLAETVGLGVPVLQRIEKPKEWQYVVGPTLYYFVRWESPPNCAVAGKPFDYVVGIPPKPAKPAPVGIHLHCWGGNLNGGYGWWYGAEQGHILVASNQIPYDWWTGYHELYWQGPAKEDAWKAGVVHPYSQLRMLSFLDWVATRWDVDLKRTHVAGSSMGGSGAPMFAIRYPERIAWAVAWVGVHIPEKSPTFKGSYANSYGPPEWGVKFEDGTPVWDHFNDAWYLRKHPEKEIGLICFSNGKNDGGIGWPQAWEFYRALRDTKRPHLFVWGQGGHGQRAQLPVTLSDRFVGLEPRTDQSQPAFTACGLDDNPGTGSPADGDAKGQVNLYLFWDTGDVVDRADRWEMTVGLVDKAPQDRSTVSITPRRLQLLKPQPGEKFRWTNTPAGADKAIQSGQVTADEYGLVTLPEVIVSKEKNRIAIRKQ
jgi:pimeloyl-ACP methyl ester carboxylesterase